MHAINLSLYAPTQADDGLWYPVRPYGAGSRERVDFPCILRGPCLIVCCMLNTELKAQYNAMLVRLIQQRRSA